MIMLTGNKSINHHHLDMGPPSCKNYHVTLFSSSIFLKCSSRETKVRPCSIARAATQISFSGIRCPFLYKRLLMRPYSLLVPMSHARTVLTAAKFSIHTIFALGRPDLKAPKKKFSNNSGRNEYLSRPGNMLLDGRIFCKEGNHYIGIKQIFTTHSGLPSHSYPL